MACAKICPSCGRSTKDLSHQTCRRCATPAGRVRGPCRGCDRYGVLLDDGLCRACREAAVRMCGTCNGQDVLTDGRCHRCLLAAEFDEILAVSPSAWVIALRDSVLKTANATTTNKWLHHSTSGRLLMSMARGETAVSYEMLDQHTGRGIDHLRGLLISTGGLELEVRWIDQLAHELTKNVSAIDDRADRKVITGWLRWKALPRLRRRVEQGASTTHSAANVRRQMQQILLFVAGIEQRTRTLATCTQSEIDIWFAQPGKTRTHIRPFLEIGRASCRERV